MCRDGSALHKFRQPNQRFGPSLISRPVRQGRTICPRQIQCRCDIRKHTPQRSAPQNTGPGNPAPTGGRRREACSAMCRDGSQPSGPPRADNLPQANPAPLRHTKTHPPRQRTAEHRPGEPGPDGQAQTGDGGRQSAVPTASTFRICHSERSEESVSPGGRRRETADGKVPSLQRQPFVSVILSAAKNPFPQTGADGKHADGRVPSLQARHSERSEESVSPGGCRREGCGRQSAVPTVASF